MNTDTTSQLFASLKMYRKSYEQTHELYRSAPRVTQTIRNNAKDAERGLLAAVDETLAALATPAAVGVTLESWHMENTREMRQMLIDCDLHGYVKTLDALTAALATPAAASGAWVPVATPPAPYDTANGPAPFSPDVLLWLDQNTRPIVGYYDYRMGYDCYIAYDDEDADRATHWQLIVAPAHA